MRYGFFDDAAREYIITDPRTPVKWINYIGTLAFGGIVDHTGGALICAGDPASNRITRYIPQLAASEFKGETLYLRQREGDGYRVWSPFFVPTLDPYDRYECHVGLGYTRIVSEFYGLRTAATIFVPPGEACELRDVHVTNLTDRPVELDAVPVVEYSHPDALKQFTNADWVPQTMQSRVWREDDGLLVLAQYPFMLRDRQVNFFTANRPVSSFESDRRHFLGANEYGTWARPLSLQADELGDHEALRGDNVGALMVHLGTLQPGETVRLITQLGQAVSVDAALPATRRYRDPDEVDRAFAALGTFWDDYLARVQVETPSAALDHMLNVHNPRQCQTTLNWSRELSLYQVGLGARGMGFRDSAQDVMGVVAHAPEAARAVLEKLLRVQRADGSAMHQFNPRTMVANMGDSRDVEGAPRYYGDDHLWIVLAVTAYLKETGDLDFLDLEIPYYDAPGVRGTVLDHLWQALAFTAGDLGAHGLPRLGFADWNDTVNLRAGAESVFVAALYGKALLEMAALARHLGDAEMAARCVADHAAMRERVNTVAWDGEWYVRYFDADGTPLGSHANAAGQIYANAQSWPVIAGFAPPERAERALEVVHRRLDTRYGIKLSAPGYDGFDPSKGGITTYPPGAKENGGIFVHANPWVIIAEAIVGHGEQAFAVYEQINPAAQNERADEFECEPYVYPQNVLGDEHPQFGLARNSWLTGAASWAYQAATQYILGVRPEYDGLWIDPCVPRGWSEFCMRRTFRGAVYEIVVKNPSGICRGVRRLRVDGREVPDPLVPPFEDGQVHRVEVEMG